MDLIEDSALLDTTFLVIDFETTTPKGHPAQAIEVAVMAIRHDHGHWLTAGELRSFIQPPAFAPLTPADFAATGITQEDLVDAPTAEVALRRLDRRLAADRRYLLVAHHASTEANVIAQHAEACPKLSRLGFIDTIRLAKVTLPSLGSYRLDSLIDHLDVPITGRRHRAATDVHATASVFVELLRQAALGGQVRTLDDLVRVAGRSAAMSPEAQRGLF